jgi:hypothetical protein
MELLADFSKLSKKKIKWIANEYFSTPADAVAEKLLEF